MKVFLIQNDKRHTEDIDTANHRETAQQQCDAANDTVRNAAGDRFRFFVSISTLRRVVCMPVTLAMGKMPPINAAASGSSITLISLLSLHECSTHIFPLKSLIVSAFQKSNRGDLSGGIIHHRSRKLLGEI